MYTKNGCDCRQEMELLKQKVEMLEKKSATITDNPVKRINYDEKISADCFSYMLAENVTAIVGLREAIRSKRWSIKITWATLFSIGIAATSYYLIKTVLEFTKNPTGTKINIIAPSDYPKQTFKFCIDDWIDPKKVTSTGLSVEALSYGLGYTLSQYHVLNDIELSRNEFETFYRRRNFSSPVAFYVSIAYDPVFTSDARYNTSDIDKPVFYCDSCLMDYGLQKSFVFQHEICYQLRLKPVERKSSKVLDAVEMEIIAPFYHLTSNEVPDWNLLVESDDGTVYPTPFESSILLLNKQNVVLVSRNVIRKLNTASNPCLEKESGQAFRCMSGCVGDMFRPTHNCTVLLSRWQTQRDISDWCNRYIIELLESTLSATENDSLESSNENNVWQSMAECSKHCITPCTTTIYQIVTQSLDLPQTMLDSKSDLSLVTLRLSDTAILIGVLEFEEYSVYTFDSFIGNMGGTLGLFCGATVYTFFQLIFALVEYYLDKHPTTA